MAIPALDTNGPASDRSFRLHTIRGAGSVWNISTIRSAAPVIRATGGIGSSDRERGLFDFLILDGSFITASPAPRDINLIAVLKPGHDFERDLPLSEYALVSRSMLRRRFGFDVMVAERDSQLYKTYVEFFSRVRESPELRKGLLRLIL